MSSAHREDRAGDAMSVVRLAGARPVPSPESMAAARAHVHAAWRSGVERRRARMTLLLAAAGLAAAAVVAVGVRGVRQRGLPSAPAARTAVEAAHAGVEVARLDAATGLVEHEDASGWVRLAVGDTLRPGVRLRTLTGGAGLRAPDGRSLRVAPASRLVWAAPERLMLEAGAVYSDSGPGARAGARFEVRTPWGVVHETGTQFEVRVEAAGLRVRVREGRVEVVRKSLAGGDASPDGASPDGASPDGASQSRGPAQSPGGPAVEATAGVELRIGERGVERRPFPRHGPDWSWALALAPAFEMDGRALHELVSWAAREAGWELRYADAEAERRSRLARLRGSVRGLRPDEAAAAVIPSTGLPHRIGDGVLRIGPAGVGADGR